MTDKTIAAASPAGSQCAHIRCWNTIEARSTGRPARFCSTSCRQADHRGRKAAAEAAARLVDADRQLQATYERAVKALGGIVDAARFDGGPVSPTPESARREARSLLADLELLAERFRADRKTAAVYGLSAPSQAPVTVAVLQLDTPPTRRTTGPDYEATRARARSDMLGLHPPRAIPDGG